MRIIFTTTAFALASATQFSTPSCPSCSGSTAWRQTSSLGSAPLCPLLLTVVAFSATFCILKWGETYSIIRQYFFFDFAFNSCFYPGLPIAFQSHCLHNWQVWWLLSDPPQDGPCPVFPRGHVESTIKQVWFIHAHQSILSYLHIPAHGLHFLQVQNSFTFTASCFLLKCPMLFFFC